MMTQETVRIAAVMAVGLMTAATPGRAQSAPDFDKAIAVSMTASAAQAESSIAIGDTVINKERQAGIVMRLMPNGAAEVLFDANNWMASRTSLDKLSKSVACQGLVCVGQKVANRKTGEVGTVAMLFANGEAKVLDDGASSKSSVRVERLKPVSVAGYDSVPCSGSVCVGDWVHSKESGRIGTVGTITSKGQAQVLPLNDWGCLEEKIAALAPAVSAKNGVRVGQRVRGQGKSGTVAMIFDDGDIRVGSDKTDVNEDLGWFKAAAGELTAE